MNRRMPNGMYGGVRGEKKSPLLDLQNSTFELFVTYTYNEGEETEVHRMKEKTFHVYVDSHDRSLLLQSLVELKNLLIQQGRYTDCVDELIFKVINAPLKKIKTFYVGGQDE